MMITHRNCAMGKTTATMFLAALVLFGAFTCVAESAAITTENSIRVCSSHLSDLLYLVCLGRGYNEPNGTEETADLVEQCCMKRCTYEYLLQYCKPEPTPQDKVGKIRDVIESDELRIVSLPSSTSSSRQDISTEQYPKKLDTDNNGAIKRKVDDMKKGRHRGKIGHNDDRECKGNADTKKRHNGRHCKCRRRRLQCRQASKIQIAVGGIKTLDNKFTTSSSLTAKPIKTQR